MAVDVLGAWCDLVVGERSERVLHHLELAVEVSRPGLVGERGDERGGAELVEERVGVAQGSLLEAPHRLAPAQSGDQVVDHVGRERTRQSRLDIALRAVVEHRPRRGDLRRGVGEVVRQHLVHVGAATGGEMADGLADHAVGEVDGVGGGDEVGGR